MIFGAIRTFMVKVGGVAAGFILHFIMARFLTVNEFGVYALYFSASIVLAAIGRFSLDISVVRIISEYTVEEFFPNIKGIIHWCLAVTLGICFCISISLVFYALYSGKSDVFYVIPLFGSLAFTTLAQGVSRALGIGVYAFIPDMIVRPALTVLLAILMFFTLSNFSLSDALRAHSFASLFVSISIWCYLYLTIYKKYTAYSAVFESRRWFVVAGPVFITNFLNILEAHLIVLLAGWLLSDTDTAQISIAVRVATLASLVTMAVNMYIAPILAKQYASGHIERFNATLAMATKIMIASALPTTLILCYFGVNILSIFGAGYSEGLNILVILLVSRFIASFFGPVILAMQMSKYEKQSAVLTFSSLLLFVIFAVISAKSFGGQGLVFSAGVMTIFRQCAGWLYLKNINGLQRC